MLDRLITLVGLLAALSGAAGQLVNIVKAPFPWLNTQPLSPLARLVLQLLAVAAGIVTAWLAEQLLDANLRDGKHLLLLGLLASIGTKFWKDLLDYLTSIKGIAASKAKTRRVAAAAAAYRAARALGAVPPPPGESQFRAAPPRPPADLPDDLVAVASRNLRRAIEQAGQP